MKPKPELPNRKQRYPGKANPRVDPNIAIIGHHRDQCGLEYYRLVEAFCTELSPRPRSEKMMAKSTHRPGRSKSAVPRPEKSPVRQMSPSSRRDTSHWRGRVMSAVTDRGVKPRKTSLNFSGLHNCITVTSQLESCCQFMPRRSADTRISRSLRRHLASRDET